MKITYKTAWKEGDTALYIDFFDRKYAAKKGNLSWRINNPGLIKHHSRYAKKNGSIGAWKQFAIFSNPQQGHQALKEWLQSTTILENDLFDIAKYYQPSSSKQFAQSLAAANNVPCKTKLKDLTQAEFNSLLSSLENLCGFKQLGDEEFSILPKIAAKIECSDEKTELYLVGTDIALSQQEAVDWVIGHKLDAVIVHHANKIHLRSRPHYHVETLKQPLQSLQNNEPIEEFDTLVRLVGKKAPGQCVWGFVNGVKNTRRHAIKSAHLISKKAENEQVLFLKNDQAFEGIKDFMIALLLKAGVDTPVVKNAVLFFRHLISISKNNDSVPIVLFAHSQGAAITRHALSLLSKEERQKIRFFTFGGWSFIPQDFAHPDSHNYASVGDLVPRIGAYNSQYLALRRHEGIKKGLDIDKIIQELAFEDAIHDLDCLSADTLEKYTQERGKFYKAEFDKINNVIVVDTGNLWEHAFKNDSYQKVVGEIIRKYRKYGENTSS